MEIKIPELALVAEDNGAVVGHAVATRGDVAGHPALGLGPVSVRPDRQGTGIGSRLVAAAIEWASDQQLPLVVRSNIKREEAHAFYTALGFDRQKSQHVYVKRLDRYV